MQLFRQRTRLGSDGGWGAASFGRAGKWSLGAVDGCVVRVPTAEGLQLSCRDTTFGELMKAVMAGKWQGAATDFAGTS